MKKLYTTIVLALISGMLFSQLRIYTPEQVAPDNGEMGQYPAAVLDWNAVTGNSYDITYEVLLDTDPGFSNPETFQTMNTAVVNSNLLFDTWYYWKVRAWDDIDTSFWSETWSFKVLNTVVLGDPPNNREDRNPDVTIYWDSIPGVTHYQVQIDTSYYFSNVLTSIENELRGVHTLNENLAYAVGASGTVAMYDGAEWTSIDIGTNEDLYGVFFLNENAGWVCGDGGTMYYYDGSSWTQQEITATDGIITALYMLDETNGYAVAESGQVLMFDGSAWTEQASLEGVLYDIEFLDASTAWAVGEGGNVYYFDGTEWIDQSIDGADDLMSVEILSTTNAWAAGGSGEIYHYNGSEWMMSESNDEDETDIFALSMLDENTGYALGEAEFLLVFDGTSWKVNSSGIDADMFAMSLMDDGTGWAVGGEFGGDLYEDQIVVMNFGGESFNSPFAYIKNINTTSGSIKLSTLPFGSNIFWRMRALHPEDTSGWSPVKNFYTFSQIELDKPVDGSEEPLFVKLLWKEKTGVNGYQIELAMNEQFDNPEFFFIDSLSIFLEDLGFGETYFWRGRAVHAHDTSDWSETRNFNTIDQVYLSSPENNATDVTVLPSLRWEKILSVPRYQVQLSPTADFDSLMYNNITGDTNAFQVIQKLQNNEDYFWRVRGVVIKPDTSGWSEVWSFTTEELQGIGDEQGLAEAISVYPNPSKGEVTIAFNGNNSEMRLMVMDLVGKVYADRQLTFSAVQSTQRIDLQELPEGIYLLKLTKNDDIITRKLVIDK